MTLSTVVLFTAGGALVGAVLAWADKRLTRRKCERTLRELK